MRSSDGGRKLRSKTPPVAGVRGSFLVFTMRLIERANRLPSLGYPLAIPWPSLGHPAPIASGEVRAQPLLKRPDPVTDNSH
jgi:hypothetical protein